MPRRGVATATRQPLRAKPMIKDTTNRTRKRKNRTWAMPASCFMSRKITPPLIVLAALVGASSLAACNTVEGVGQDVQAAGEEIEETAEETHDGDPETP